MAIQESDESDVKDIEIFFGDDEDVREGLKAIVDLFNDAKTFGSLLAIPENLVGKKEIFETAIEKNIEELFRIGNADRLKSLLLQTEILERKYDCVITNPPYMGGKGMNPNLRTFTKKHFPASKSDLFAIFVERIMNMVQHDRHIGIMTPFTWMFLSSYVKLREKILNQKTLTSLIRPEYHAFFESAYVPLCTFTIFSKQLPEFKGEFIDLTEFYGAELQATKTLEAIQNPSCGWRYTASAADFKKIPGSPIAYWVGGKLLEIFSDNKCMQDFAKATGGMTTGNTSQYLRRWNEVNYCNIGQNLISREMAVESGLKWFPYNKGGTFRKWYGNHEYVVNWLNDGEDIINSGKSFPRSKNYYFKESISWSDVTSSHNSFRYYPNGFIFDVSAPSAFFNNKNCLYISLSLLNNKFSKLATKLINPTLHFNTGEFAILPYPELLPDKIIINLVKQAVNISQNDWNNNETSWEFLTIPLLQSNQKQQTLKKLFTIIRKNWNNAVLEMQRLEQENNRIFIEAYGLEEELTPEVPLKEITLTCNPHYRYGGNKSEEELETLLQTDTIKELISYAIGCMMGRYSLDHPGLIYAHSGNIDFDPSKYKTFPADDDGIIPIMDQEWFPDDATKRFLEFLKAAWTPETLEENLKFVADSLKPKTNESPVDTIRRYISTGFFKDHLRTYKKRPIYWLFSSGKQKAFQCLVYLHRYKESTLSRMRSAYVTPLQGHLTARIEFLQNEKDSAKTASARRKVQKTIERIRKKQAELRQFDDELRHYADMKISLDLDDGVKVNYGKFGSLLAESKAVTGKKK
ncbi:MAG: BREX-1 system adenine-specific DNA-methyltransferase PglX [Deltaproteobacteria bacterium]|nr:MAG: BREX-1 system adenine-specific DNA-methyltransferase PglX [Deltaproteobacteria bacterium]